MDGEAGNDRIDVSAVTKQAGSAQLTGPSGTVEVQLFGGPGADTEIGGAGGERFNGPGKDLLEGGAGHNRLVQ